MGVKSRDDCPSLHMIFDRYCGVVEPEEASREAVAGVGLEPDLCVDGEVGVCFEFRNDFPIVIPQHSFRMVRLQACPGKAVQRYGMTAKGMPQAVVRPLNSRLLNGVRHGNLDLGTRHGGTFRLCLRRQPCCEVLRNFDQLDRKSVV